MHCLEWENIYATLIVADLHFWAWLTENLVSSRRRHSPSRAHDARGVRMAVRDTEWAEPDPGILGL